MRNKLNLQFAIGLLMLALLTSACGGAATPDPGAVAETAAALAGTLVVERETERASAATATPMPATATEAPPTEPAAATTVAPLVVPTQNENDGTSGEGTCYAAQLTNETIPDGTVVNPGEAFTQTWTLRNIGSCDWTDDFSFVFHHGTLTGTPGRTAVGYVAAGEATSFSVTYTAPLAGNSAATHSSFWSIQSPDGLLFGAAGYQYFWVSVTVPSLPPTAKVRELAGFGYAQRSNGQSTDEIIAGDTGGNFISEAYITFNFGNIPTDAVVTSAYLDLHTNATTNGDPFGSLGCMVITELQTGQQLWDFCSAAEMSNEGYANSTILALIENAIANSGSITLVATFPGGTDNDSLADNLNMYYPLLSLDWYKP